MNAFNANPFAYIFPAVLLVAVACYYAYGAVDRVGLATQEVDAVVTGKQFTPGATTYNSNVVAGRNFIQPAQQADFYAVSVRIGDTPNVALVEKATYDALNINDRVRVRIQRTRITGQLRIIELKR
jgi:hypothetical protein